VVVVGVAVHMCILLFAFETHTVLPKEIYELKYCSEQEPFIIMTGCMTTCFASAEPL